MIRWSIKISCEISNIEVAFKNENFVVFLIIIFHCKDEKFACHKTEQQLIWQQLLIILYNVGTSLLLFSFKLQTITSENGYTTVRFTMIL